MEKGACLLHKSSIWTRWVLVPSPCCPQVYDSSWLRACATLPVSDPWRRIVQLPGSGVPLRPQTQPQEARLPQPADSRAHTIPHGAASPAAVAAFHRASVCSHHDPPQACSLLGRSRGPPSHTHTQHTTCSPPAPGRTVLGLLLSPPPPSLIQQRFTGTYPTRCRAVCKRQI